MFALSSSSLSRIAVRTLPMSSGVGTEAVKHFGVTYNCNRAGGDRITIMGHNFGRTGARVTVNGRPCHSLVHDVPEMVVSCTAPAGMWSGTPKCEVGLCS